MQLQCSLINIVFADSFSKSWTVQYTVYRSAFTLNVLNVALCIVLNLLAWAYRTNTSRDCKCARVLNRTTLPSDVTCCHSNVTVVGYFFCNDPIPYRTTVPGSVVTLAQFKRLLSKRGNFRLAYLSVFMYLLQEIYISP